MVYDRDLADRIRRVISGTAGLSERAMFGGVGFLIHGNMAVAASSDGGLLIRVEPARAEELVQQPGVHRFAMRGRTMDGWLTVSADQVATDTDLQQWAETGIGYAESLPPKPPQRSQSAK